MLISINFHLYWKKTRNLLSCLLQARSPKSRCQHPWRCSGGNCSGPSSTFCSFRRPVACKYITSVSHRHMILPLHLHTTFPLCLSLCSKMHLRFQFSSGLRDQQLRRQLLLKREFVSCSSPEEGGQGTLSHTEAPGLVRRQKERIKCLVR